MVKDGQVRHDLFGEGEPAGEAEEIALAEKVASACLDGFVLRVPVTRVRKYLSKIEWEPRREATLVEREQKEINQ